MSLFPTSNGVPYLPDGYAQVDPPRPLWPAWLQVAIFVACYVALQGLYARSGGTAVERFFLESAGSRPAAAVLDLLQPALQVRAVGTRVVAPGGGLNIGNGCEGTDLYFLLFAAFAAAPLLSWRRRAAGFALGLMLAFLLNQVRILALFHAYRADPTLFDLLHTTVAPIVLVIAMALYFHAWLRLGSPLPGSPA